MTEKVPFELVTPERVVFAEEADMVVVPGGDGDFGVLPGHADVLGQGAGEGEGPGAIQVHLPVARQIRLSHVVSSARALTRASILGRIRVRRSRATRSRTCPTIRPNSSGEIACAPSECTACGRG